MSTTPPIKLNLKALKAEPKEISVPSTESEKAIPVLAQTEDIPQKENISEIIKDKVTEKESDSTKSHNISFADLTRQIEDKNPKKVEKRANDVVESENSTSTKITAESNIAENIIQKETEKVEEKVEKKAPISLKTNNIDKEDKTEIPQVTQENSTLKSKNDSIDSTQADKTALENATKTQSILKEKEEKKSKKKKRGLFSMFKRKKGEKTQDKEVKVDATVSVNQGDTKEEIVKDTPVEVEKEKVHFLNYESHFKKESSNFLKRFQNFKYAPSTRFGMVLGMIGITVLIIGGLMVFFPEKHSLDIYKASILELSNKTPEAIITQDVKQNFIQEDSPGDLEQSEPIVVEEDISSQDESKEKLRQHLLNKYK